MSIHRSSRLLKWEKRFWNSPPCMADPLEMAPKTSSSLFNFFSMSTLSGIIKWVEITYFYWDLIQEYEATRIWVCYEPDIYTAGRAFIPLSTQVWVHHFHTSKRYILHLSVEIFYCHVLLDPYEPCTRPSLLLELNQIHLKSKSWLSHRVPSRSTSDHEIHSCCGRTVCSWSVGDLHSPFYNLEDLWVDIFSCHLRRIERECNNLQNTDTDAKLADQFMNRRKRKACQAASLATDHEKHSCSGGTVCSWFIRNLHSPFIIIFWGKLTEMHLSDRLTQGDTVCVISGVHFWDQADQGIFPGKLQKRGRGRPRPLPRGPKIGEIYFSISCPMEVCIKKMTCITDVQYRIRHILSPWTGW